MLNTVCLNGRLIADPELKTTPNGDSVSTVVLAVDRNAKAKGGSKMTDFITVVLWQHMAEFVARYFGKGGMIAVTGELQTRKYEDKDGVKRTIYEVIATQVNFCGDSKPKNGSAPAHAETANFENIAEGDDLPF